MAGFSDCGRGCDDPAGILDAAGMVFGRVLLYLQACVMVLCFYKENPEDRIFWVDNPEVIGEFLFSFDKKKVYNLFADYPYGLSAEERRIFDEENPYWADFPRTGNSCFAFCCELLSNYLILTC